MTFVVLVPRWLQRALMLWQPMTHIGFNDFSEFIGPFVQANKSTVSELFATFSLDFCHCIVTEMNHVPVRWDHLHEVTVELRWDS